MESAIRNVRDIESDERRVYEAVLGHKLQENQQIILQVITVDARSTEPPAANPSAPPNGQLPDWCNVYDGLSDKEVDEVESVILDRSGWTPNHQ